MANNTSSPLDEIPKNSTTRVEVEDKVRQMLDPEIKDSAPDDTTTVGTAPELSGDLPVMAAPTQVVSDNIEAIDEAANELDKAKVNETKIPEKVANPKSSSKWERFRHGWISWWKNPVKRRLTLAGLAVFLLIVFTVPNSRYFVLNNVGIRSKASLLVLDDSTQQPLKNVQVDLSEQTQMTDDEGRVTFEHLKLGQQSITLHKRAYADSKRDVTIGWGSNPIGSIAITPTGSQYSFEVKDYLSGNPLSKVEAVSGEYNALSDEEGIIKLAIDDTGEVQTVDVVFSADNYRSETITLNLDNQEATKLEMVPSRKHVFVSKRSGKYDIYTIDVDGKNETKILSGSGVERDDLVLVPHPTNSLVALVSTRENVRNSSGFLLSTLTLIDPATNTPSKIAQSEKIQIIDWIKDRLVYVQIKEGASASDAKRHRLMSYDTQTGTSIELAASNYFNDIISVNGSILYAPSSTYSSDAPGFFKISADGSAKQTVMNEEVYNIFRTEYDKLVLYSVSSWYDYQISANKTTKLSGEPPNLISRIYVTSPDGTHSLWVDNRDGKGVLLDLTTATQEEKTVTERSGLQNPVRWLSDDALVFRVSNAQETADYVLSLSGGEPRKLRDVTNTAGIDRWYYY